MVSWSLTHCRKRVNIFSGNFCISSLQYQISGLRNCTHELRKYQKIAIKIKSVFLITEAEGKRQFVLIGCGLVLCWDKKSDSVDESFCSLTESIQFSVNCTVYLSVLQKKKKKTSLSVWTCVTEREMGISFTVVVVFIQFKLCLHKTKQKKKNEGERERNTIIQQQ